MARLTIALFMLAICAICVIGTSACGPNQVFDKCASACPVTCKNRFDKNPRLCPAVCVPRCKCINRTILSEDGRCVLPNEC